MEKYIIGLQLMIVGMGTVLLALFLLAVVLNLGKKFMAQETESGPVTTKEGLEPVTRQVPDSTRGPDEIPPRKVAAITAAITHLLQQESKSQYQIISITKNRLEGKGGN